MGNDSFRKAVGRRLRPFTNLHVQGHAANVFILSTPRSGSTWLMETVAAERGMKPCNEPFNLRKAEVVAALGVADWAELESNQALTRMESYLRKFETGSLAVGFKNLRPFEKGYRAFTNRIVFKILHACENRVPWLRSHFGAQVVYLLRHPAPVSLSRTVLPRLGSLVETRLSGTQQEFGRRVLESGSPVERSTLDWCLQNKPLLDDLSQIDLVVAYEQMVMEPHVVIDRLVEVLGLRCVGDIRQSVDGLSRSVAISDSSRLALLERRHKSPCDLVTRWQRDMTQEQMRAMEGVLDRLEIDAYSVASPWPAKRFWLQPIGEMT